MGPIWGISESFASYVLGLDATFYLCQKQRRKPSFKRSKMTAPLAFVSYSHDSPEHKEWVLELALYLRENGIDIYWTNGMYYLEMIFPSLWKLA